MRSLNGGEYESINFKLRSRPQIGLTSKYGIATACGYPYATCVDNYDDLDRELNGAKERKSLSLVEVKCAIGARDDLGRPTTSAIENRRAFMKYLMK